MHPDDVALVDLVTGQPVTPKVAAHVATCPRCADELAVLRDVLGLVREPRPELVPVPHRVWDAVAAGLDLPARPDSTAPTTPAAGAAADDTGRPVSDDLAARRAGRARRRVAVGWVVGAAAAGLVLGGAGATLLDREPPAPAAVTVASTSLDTLDTRQAMGSAEVVSHDGRVDLAVHTGGPMDPGAATSRSG